MVDFPSHPDCTRCPLHEQCQHPGLATRPADFLLAPDFTRPALLVIGQAPGYIEDTKRVSWIGPSGKLLHGCLTLSHLDQVADIYLANACRCRPPQETDPSPGQFHACCIHTFHDIALLQAAYPRRDVIILLCGAIACRAFANSSLVQAMHLRGRPTQLYIPKKLLAEVPIGPTLPTFATYHTAFIRSREPTLIYAVRDHLALIHDHITSTRTTPANTPPDFTLLPPESPPAVPPRLISLDIETYGALAKYNQTVFHPVKSVVIDKCPIDQLVQTVSLGWEDQLSGAETAMAFNYQDSGQRAILYQWIRALVDQNGSLLGQNIPFDLMYLRHTDPFIRSQLRPYIIPVEDVLLWNFLQSENRPERGLKDVAHLFNLMDYGDISTIFNSSGPNDPALLRYNAKDCIAALRARRLLRRAIERDYGPDTRKLSDFCRQHASDLIWLAVVMGENGIALSIPGVQALNDREQALAKSVRADAKDRLGLKFAGAGSMKSVQKLVESAADEADLLRPLDARLLLTDKTKEVSTKEENVSLLVSSLPLASGLREPLSLLLQYREHAKMVDTYTGPLLTQPARGIVRILPNGVGLAYPSWYTCPSRHDLDNEEKMGGTIQGRITCKRPALQTDPDAIKACRTSRFPNGILVEADLSQIERRVAALLSGDPALLDEYARHLDGHALTGAAIYALVVPSEGEAGFWQRPATDDPLRLLFRFMGKTTNFLLLYEGQAPKLYSTILSDIGRKINELGLRMPSLPDCQAIVDWHDGRFRRLREWQRELVDLAVRQRYIELSSGWSRAFVGKRGFIEGKDRGKVLSLPCQCIAAQFMQGSQSQAQRLIQQHRLSSTLMTMQAYDSVLIDTTARELPVVRLILSQTLPNPPLLGVLERELGRTVPIEYNVKETPCSPAPRP